MVTSYFLWKISYKLQNDDQIFVYNFNFTTIKNKKIKNKYRATKKELSSSSGMFIENNENFVVINKPAGIAVQSGTKSRRNILDILNRRSEFEGTKPYAVHRIDKETTGILIVAKNRKYAQLFTTLFRIRKIHKTYLCVCSGEIEKSEGLLEDNLIRFEKNKKIVEKAITKFKVIDKNKGGTLLVLNPITGRKHQLRKQLSIFGFPVIGDTKYNYLIKGYRKNNRLMLHAYSIKFKINEKKYTFFVDIPDHFKKVLLIKKLNLHKNF